MNQESTDKKSRPRRRLWLRGTLVLATLLVLLFFAMPSILSSDYMRDRVLHTAMKDSSLVVSSQSASFGWFTPVTLEGLTINSPDDQLSITIAKLQMDRTWLQLYLSPRELGHLELYSPQVNCDLDWQGFQGYSAGEVPSFSADIHEAALTVALQREQEPVVDLAKLNVSLRIEDNDQGRFLVVDESTVIDNRQLTPEMCGELLQLMDPMLGDVVKVEGRFSLELDRLRVPLNVSPEEQQKQMNLAGRLILHDVNTSAKTPLIKGIVRVAADMHNKPASEVVRVVNMATIDLEIREARLYHSGLSFGLPDIDPELLVQSQGSVGLDETLDVHVTIPKLFLDQGPLSATLPAEAAPAEATPAEAATDKIAELHITGTIAKPVVTRLDQPHEDTAHELSQTSTPTPTLSQADATAKPVSFPLEDTGTE